MPKFMIIMCIRGIINLLLVLYCWALIAPMYLKTKTLIYIIHLRSFLQLL